MAYPYKELIVWQKSIELVVLIYKFTELFPKPELYGLTNQIRRAAVSIPANIAEGSARGHRKEYCQFVRIAYASGAELETHLTIAKRLDFGNPDGYKTIDQLLEEILRMTNTLARRLAGSDQSD